MPKAQYEVFEKLITELTSYDLRSVASASGVSFSTLNNWVNYRVLAPQLRTFLPVAESIGFDLKLVKRKAHLELVA